MRPARRAARAVVSLLMCLPLVSLTSPLFAQCSLCRTALQSSPEGQQMAEGFNDAILFLLGAPFLIVGLIGAPFLWAWCQGRWGRDPVRGRLSLPFCSRERLG